MEDCTLTYKDRKTAKFGCEQPLTQQIAANFNQTINRFTHTFEMKPALVWILSLQILQLATASDTL